MRVSIIVSAFVIFFVSIATGLVAWNQQRLSEGEDKNATISAEEEFGDEPIHASPQPSTEAAEVANSGELSQQPSTEQMLEEIESIRRQLGIELFPSETRGTEKQDFRNALKSVVAKESGAREPASDPTQPALEQNLDRQLSPESPLKAVPTEDFSQNAQLIDVLQEAIFALEQRAALAEQQWQYDSSDRSRRLAHKLRKEIRTLRNSHF